MACSLTRRNPLTRWNPSLIEFAPRARRNAAATGQTPSVRPMTFAAASETSGVRCNTGIAWTSSVATAAAIPIVYTRMTRLGSANVHSRP